MDEQGDNVYVQRNYPTYQHKLAYQPEFTDLKASLNYKHIANNTNIY